MEKSLFSSSYEAVRQHLVALRKTAGLTQQQLADRLDREQNLIARIEIKERRLDLFEYFQLCRACGVDPVKAAAELMRELAALEKGNRKSPKDWSPRRK